MNKNHPPPPPLDPTATFADASDPRCPSCLSEVPASVDACLSCGRSAIALTVGQTLDGRYEMKGYIGQGSLGAVYHGYDTRLDETVALKVLHRGIAPNREAAKRFREQLKLARRVRHRHVCGIGEWGQRGAVRWITLEFMEGVDLETFVRETPGLTAGEAFRLALQIAEGLLALHEEGLVHRNLKTANVMLGPRGDVRIMDAGLCPPHSAGDGGSAACAPLSRILGTPEFMSPEQARGEPSIDHRSDAYSFGLVLYHLFVGTPPFRGDSPLATLQRHIHEPPPLDTGLGAERLPGPLVPVLRRLLAKEPAQRYTTTAQMVAALQAAARGAAGSPSLSSASSTSIAAPAGPPAAVAAVEHASVERTVQDERPRSRRELPPSVVAAPPVVIERRLPPLVPEVAPVALPPATAEPTPPRSARMAAGGPPAVAAGTPAPREAPLPVREEPAPSTDDVSIVHAPAPAPPAERARALPRAPVRSPSRLAIAGLMLLMAALGAISTITVVLLRRNSGPGVAEGAPPPASELAAPAAVPATTAPDAGGRSASQGLGPASTSEPPATLRAAIPAATTLPPAQKTQLVAPPVKGPLPLLTAAAAAPRPLVDDRGALAIEVLPGTVVELDGSVIGERTRFPVDTGEHIVRLLNPDYEPMVRNVTVRSGETTTVIANLLRDGKRKSRAAAPAPRPAASDGTLQVSATPYAQVFVDDRDLGATPIRAATLSAGVHIVRLVHPEYQPVERRVTVITGAVYKLFVDLPVDGVHK